MNESLQQGVQRSAHPDEMIGLAQLMRKAYAGEDLGPLGAQLVTRGHEASDANALMDLSILLQLRQNRELGLAVQREALVLQQVYRPPTLAGTASLRVLALLAPGDMMTNTPLEFLLEQSDISLEQLYMAPDLPIPQPLPEHDVLFVAVGESDGTLALLHALEGVVGSWPRPVVNRPSAIARLARDSVCAMLADVAGAVMPVTARLTREELEMLGRGEFTPSHWISDATFPLIVRPVDSHAGQGLQKLDDAMAIAAYLQQQAQSHFYISPFVDYRGVDGRFRKFRIVLIEGQPFVCHMAVSEHWMVHYLNAGMDDNADKRAEEARFMSTFDDEFAPRHAQVWHAIHQRMGLDYLGIDCAETPTGELLVFEVDSNMIVHAMDPPDRFAYKQPQMRKVFSAFRDMLKRRAQLRVDTEAEVHVV